jgi:hypothetical protein
MSDNKGKYRTEIQQVRDFSFVNSLAIVCVIMRYWTGVALRSKAILWSWRDQSWTVNKSWICRVESSSCCAVGDLSSLLMTFSALK